MRQCDMSSVKRWVLQFIIGITLVFGLATIAKADQRFESVGGFCHFVLNPNNDDNEIFFANCKNSIRVNDDGTADGSTMHTVSYPKGAEPINASVAMVGAGNHHAAIAQWLSTATVIADTSCVMVDSNGTAYETTDWTARYILIERQRKPVEVGGGWTPAKVRYELVCNNAYQQ